MPFDSIQTNLDAHQLRTARGLIADPRLWLQGHFTDELPDGRRAHCTYAALHQAVTGKPFLLVHMLTASLAEENRVLELARLLLAAAPPRGRRFTARGESLDDMDADTQVCTMNNTVSHEELMATFARAIATAEAQNLPV